jgi:hypothetical protein
MSAPEASTLTDAAGHYALQAAAGWEARARAAEEKLGERVITITRQDWGAVLCWLAILLILIALSGFAAA